MWDNNIYHDGHKQFNPQKMSERQQVLYLMERTKQAGYDPEKDVALLGKSRGSVNDIDYSELFEQEKKRAVIRGRNHISRKREELFKNHPERLMLLAESLRCFTPIRKNKYIDKKFRKVSKREELPQSCVCTLPTRVYGCLPANSLEIESSSRRRRCTAKRSASIAV